MLKKSSQEPLGQFQPNLAENMPGRWRLIFVQIRDWPLLGPNKGQMFKTLLFMSQWPECIDIWYGASF